MTPAIPEHSGVIPAELATIEPQSLRAWILACRPATLSAAVVPVLVGTACAHSERTFRPGPGLAALSGALLLQIASNFANDLYDYEKGADTKARLGPTRAVQAGLLRPSSVRFGLALVLGLALLIGAYLALASGPWIIVIGVAAVVSALAYTAGPYPLGYHGLGDVFVMIFFGFVAVCGTAFVHLGHIPEIARCTALPVGSLATAILVVNNIRDRETDKMAGKATIAVRFGTRVAQTEYVALLCIAYMMPFVVYFWRLASVWVLLPLATLPIGVRWMAFVATRRGVALNDALVGTARLLLIYGVLLTIGIALGT
jgi:1,4-dihydroxy-2-naphthoate octaprenyltransferase